ncbi:MAG: Cof-type HAD-IIB family hydrolase [Mycoplasma sp.]|nr:Cof-type HAD-IIB family hydrolase [Mycoplasma sp.]
MRRVNKENLISVKSKDRVFDIEAIFIDLDGTLFDKWNKKISKKNIEAVRERQKEIPFIISTGRSYSKKVKKIMELLNIDYAICQNGAVVVDKSGNILQNITLSENQVSKILDITKKNKLGFTINSEFLIYTNHWLWVPFRFLWKKRWKLIKKYKFEENKVNKIVVAGFIKTKKVWELAEYMNNEIKGLSIKTSGRDKVIEITCDSATKGKGAQFISNILGIDVKNTVHIGDSENDTTTLGIVGALIAVKDGSLKLLNVATHIGPNHKRGGVSKILNGDFIEKIN